MKTIFLFLITGMLICCANRPQNNDSMNDLKLRVKATFSGLVGYGTVYKCEVVEVLQGEFNKNTVPLTVLAADTSHAKMLDDNQSPAVLDISFSKGEEQVSYGMMPITGLIDDKKTAWLVERVSLK